MAFRLLLALILAAGLGWTQAQPKQSTAPSSQPQTKQPALRPEPAEPGDVPTPLNSPAKLLKYQHDEVMKDMEKLVKLVNDVQEEMEKAGENVLPLRTLNKLEEVEKLSRKIRGRIKQ